MITSKNDRMLELLWFVGYCGEFPSQLASRVGGHPEWNRHVKYRAIKDGLVTVSRDKDRQRIIRSLHLTQEGLDYIGERDPVALSYVLALQGSETTGRPSTEKILRSSLGRHLHRHGTQCRGRNPSSGQAEPHESTVP